MGSLDGKIKKFFCPEADADVEEPGVSLHAVSSAGLAAALLE